MKLIKSLWLVAAMAMAVPAQAQFTSGAKTSSSTSGDTTPYNRISLSYNHTSVSANKQAGDFDFSLNGVGFEYTHGFSLSANHPVFLELGLKARYSVGTYDSVLGDFGDFGAYDSADGPSVKFKFLTATVPLNLAYAFPVNERFSISPFAGINFKCHISGKMKGEYEDKESESLNVFDKDDMGGEDNSFSRFQMGWQIGLGFRYDSCYLGLSYGTDFIKIYKHDKASVGTGDFALSLGYCF